MRYLEQHQGSATHLVAVNGSQSAAPFILQSGKAVIAMGGFGGSDPAPTLSEFKHMVATGKVHYVYVSEGPARAGGRRHARRHRRTASTGTRTGRRTRGGGLPGGSGGSGTRGGQHDQHRQCRRRLGREVRDDGLVQRLRRPLDGRDPVLRQQLGGVEVSRHSIRGNAMKATR